MSETIAATPQAEQPATAAIDFHAAIAKAVSTAIATGETVFLSFTPATDGICMVGVGGSAQKAADEMDAAAAGRSQPLPAACW